MRNIGRKIAAWLICLALLAGLCPAALADNLLSIPGTLKTIPDECFYGDTSLSAAVLGEGVKVIGSRAFANSSLTSISLPSTIEEIADDAFDGSSLKNVSAKSGTYAYTWARQKGYIRQHKALLIGEKTFLWYNYGNPYHEIANRNIGDVNNMVTMLKRVTAADGVPFDVTLKTDLNYEEVRKAIQTTFKDTTANDVSLFFIATHGNSNGDGDLEMANTGWTKAYNTHLSFSTLADWLTTYVQGEVIVILESCGAGSAIYDDEDPSQQNASVANGGAAEPVDGTDDSGAFASAAVRAFSRKDPGLPELEGESLSNSTGDLRVRNKFYVLAASRHHELSWGQDASNYFTDWLIEGVGRRGNSPADTNGNGALTLTELFNHIKKYDSYPIYDQYWVRYYQHVQRFPKNSAHVIFKLK